MQKGETDSGQFSRPKFGAGNEAPKEYRGPERRRLLDRREGKDRREMVRYELEKDDRRRSPDRREDRRRFDFWSLIRRG
jgi:hypothetical protein